MIVQAWGARRCARVALTIHSEAYEGGGAGKGTGQAGRMSDCPVAYVRKCGEAQSFFPATCHIFCIIVHQCFVFWRFRLLWIDLPSLKLAMENGSLSASSSLSWILADCGLTHQTAVRSIALYDPIRLGSSWPLQGSSILRQEHWHRCRACTRNSACGMMEFLSKFLGN